MNKQAYEHTVGLVLSKQAGFLDNVGYAFKNTWNDVENAWNSASEDTKRNLISTGATGILGALLGGVLGGGKGLLLGGIGGSLAGYTGSKHVYPWINKWWEHYQTGKNSTSESDDTGQPLLPR